MHHPKISIVARYRAVFCSTFVGLLMVSQTAPTAIAQTLSPRVESFLLLRNGGLMRGKINRDQSGFEVVSMRGSRYRMPNDQVAGHYSSIEEVFGFKFLQAKKKDRVAAYSELVYWCVEEKLFDEAEQVIQYIPTGLQRFKTTRPKDYPNKKHVERLQNYVSSAQKRLTDKANSQNRRKPAVAKSGPIDSSVRTVSWTSETDGKSNILQPRRGKEYLPTIAEMDAVTKDMPKNANRAFRKLQVKLSVGCNAAKCHSKTTDSFQILPTRRGQKANWRTTQKNIYFALQFVDRTDPDQSMLLKQMSTQHSEQAQPAFPPDSETYQMMRAWLFYVTDNNQLFQQKRMQKINSNHGSADPAAKQSPKDSANKNTGTDDQVPKKIMIDPTTLTPPTADQLIKQPTKLAQDPFDPEIFNRKYHPNRKTDRK